MKIPITKPYFTNREQEMALKPLESGWVVQGPYVAELEEKFCHFTGAKYAVATNSCTTAQFICSRCIGLLPGDEVLIPAFTWISTANAAEFVGAKPIFVDIDLATFNINAENIEEKITKRTKAIFPVDLFGLPADLIRIKEIAKKNNLVIVEDAACSLGARIGNVHAGTFGICGCFSMHARKAITTGEGGMLVTNSPDIAEIARSLRDHGSNKTDFARHSDDYGFLLPEFSRLGYNFRLTDIQAAIGIAQMEKLGYMLNRRQEIARVYLEELKSISSLALPQTPEGFTHAYQSFVSLFKPQEAKEILRKKDYNKIEELSSQRNQVMEQLNLRGIATRQGTHAVPIQQYYSQKYSIDKFSFPNAYIADKMSIALPLYVQMTKDEQSYVIDNLKDVLRCAA